MGQNKTKNRYTEEFRNQVLEVYNSGVYASATECALAYGIKETTLYQWISRSKQPKTEKSEQDKEIQRLNKELSRTQQELEILKKAAIYFAHQAK
jgi:transposase